MTQSENVTREYFIDLIADFCEKRNGCIRDGKHCPLNSYCMSRNYSEETDLYVLKTLITLIPHEEAETPAKNDPINHPNHYCQEGSMECLDEMEAVFGREALMNFCLLNVWKYRKRAMFKNGEEDLKKSDFYMKKYCELKEVTSDG